MPHSFLTVSAELLGSADQIADYFDGLGHRVRVEPENLEYPFPATLVTKQRHTTTIVEIARTPEVPRLKTWALYCNSCTGDTRFAIGVPEQTQVSNELDAELRALGIGLYVSGPGGVVERIPARDLAVRLEVPSVDTLPRRIRILLGPAYEKIQRSDWRGGFEEACHTLEVEARKYLIAGLRSKRLSFVKTNGKAWTVTENQIERATIGSLERMFQAIATPNQTDSQIRRSLSRINPNRRGYTHHRTSSSAEVQLRRSVGRLMWLVLNSLKLLHPG
jgi:hypothetical protein